MTNDKVIEKCKNLLLDLPNITKAEHVERIGQHKHGDQNL